jgi:c-di-GMP-binding flagellar brake protein YcgR
VEEKRKFIRLDIPVKVCYNLPGESAQTIESVCRNISAVGVRFLAKSEIKPGSQIDLSLSLPDINESIPIKAEVVWTKEDFSQGNRAFDTGLKFIHIDEEKRKIFLQYLCDRMFEQLKEL